MIGTKRYKGINRVLQLVMLIVVIMKVGGKPKGDLL